MTIVERLSSLCVEHPLREKIVVVPSLAIGHQIGDAVARGGTPWINLRFETTRTIADAVAGLDLARQGLSVLSRAQALALVERACDRVLDDTSYFAALRGSPGLHRAIQRSIDDLRLAGLEGSLPRLAFEDERKADDLSRILAAYEEELRTRKRIDRPGVVARAIALLEAGAPTPWSADAIWVGSPEVEVADRESRLVELASRGAVSARIAGTRDEDAEMPRLANVEIVAAAGEENEVRAAFRAVLREGARFDDAEVIYTVADRYLPLVFELASEYGVPATFSEGVAVSFTGPGQACLAFLRWCGDGWDASDLDLAARAAVLETGEGLHPSAFSRVLRRAQIGWGRDRYVPQLEAFVASREQRLRDADLSDAEKETKERESREGRAALALVRDLLALTEGLGETVAPAELARAALAFSHSFARVHNERDAMALAALRKMFGELAELPDAEVALVDAASRLRDAILALYTAASNPRPGHLHVAPLRSAAWSGRTRLFLIGMGEATFPGAGLQDPIVLDAERAGLNESLAPRQLAMRGEAPLRQAERLRRCLARGADATWTISFSALSLRDQRESFPASDLLEIFRASSGNAAATFDDLMKRASKSGFIDASSPLGASEWWLAEKFVARREHFEEEVERAYPWLARGDEAVAARDSLDLTRWDGLIDVDPAAIDPRLNQRLLSASQIEKMAGCPYGWFLRNVLRIEPPDDLVRDAEVWLDPAARGVLLHEIFETTMRELCEAGEKPSLARHLALMTGIAERALAEWRAKIPPPNDAAFDRQSEDVLRTCETFLRVEEKACADADARFFEVPFGFSDAASHPAGLVDPLVIDVGGGRSVRVRGRIDRIDRTSNGGWAVWDYKTGSLYGWSGPWTFSRGRKVQHAIYARAAIEMLRARGIDDDPVIEASGYSFPTPKGGGERIRKTHERGELEAVLNRTFDVIASGFFAHPEDEGECRFCDFQMVCGGAKDAAERAKEKYAANENSERVKRWRRLNDVE